MKRKFTFLIAAAFMLLTMVATTGEMWGQSRTEEVAYTLQPASGSNNAYANNCDITISGITWNLTGNSTTQPWRIGGKSLDGVDRTLYSKTAISDNITKIEVTHGAASGITINSWTVIVASDASFSTVVSTLTPTFAASTTTTINRPENKDWTGCYYKFVYNVTVSGTSNKFLEFSQAKFYKEVSGNTPYIDADDVEIAYNATEGAIDYTLTNATGNVEAATTSDWLVLDLENITTSAVPFTCSANSAAAARTATVTLSFTGASNKVVTITQAGNPNIVDNISDITAAGTYSVKGTIVAMSTRGFVLGDGTGYVYYYYGNNFSTTYTIGDKVKLSGNVVTSGSVFEFDSSTTITSVTESNYQAEDPTVLTGSAMDTRVGSTTNTLSSYIQYQGTLTVNNTYYNITSIDGATTAKGSISFPTSTTFTSLNGKVVTVTGYFVGVSSSQYYNTMIGSIEEVITSVATPTFSPEAGAYTGTQSVTISCETEGSTIYYTTDGTTPTNESTQYTAAIQVSETTTIKAIAYVGSSASTVATATYTITTPLTSMQEIFDAATSTSTQVVITFDNYVITGKNNSNNSNKAYLTDGTKGCIIYESGHGFTAGDVLNGTAVCNLVLYGNAAELTALKHNTTGLTVTTGGSVTPIVTTVNTLTAVNTGSVVTLNGLTYNGTTTLRDSENNPVVLSNTIYNASLTSGKTYNITGVFEVNYSNKRINPRSAADIVEATLPTISIEPATANPFTYVQGAGPSEGQVFEVAGENLTSDDIVATITSGADYFEITDDQVYSNTVTVKNGDAISVRMKAGLALGNDYAGVLTLTNEGAQNVTLNLSGSVTGATYTINLDNQITGGTIEADKASAAEGETVTLTAHPNAAYTFGSWTVLQDDMTTPVTVTDNQFTMPACEVYVTATFVAKPTYAITKVITPENSGTIATDDTAWEGKEVTVLVEAENGYTFSSIVISKTGEPETTIETSGNANDGFTFTMPGYAVTTTATFISNIFEGSFVKVTTLNDLEDDGYYILYNTKAMNSTLTNGRMGTTEVTVTNNAITNPNRSIVWKFEKDGDNWNLYSEKEGKYCYINGNSTSSFAMGDDADYSFEVTNYNDGGFKFLTTHTNGRGIYQIVNEYASYAASNNPKVYLYKYTVLTERTITFNGNGGTTNTSATSYTQIVYDGVASTLTPNQFAKDNSIFAGWALTTDGEVVYADQAEVTINADLNLYAKWNVSYTATVADNITGGTVKIDDGSAQGVSSISVAAGTEITLTQTPDLGYVFSAWNVYKTGDPETNVPVTNNKFEMPAYNVTISATYNEAETYSLVTSVNQIVSGKHYIIASGTEGNNVKAMGQQYTNNRAAVSVTINGTTISKTEGVYEFVINGPDANDNYIIYDVANKGYLYAASSSNNYLRNQPTNDANGIWSFSINGDTHAATVIAQGDNTNKYMRFNNSLFSCYSSNSSIKNPVYFYMKDNDNDYEYYSCDITYEQTSIPAGETITIGEGSVMTVPNNFENDNPAALVIEDGGQLIHTSPVEATIQKNVSAAPWPSSSKGVGGWYLIASPVANLPIGCATTGDYDFYAYDEEHTQWLNQKVGANNITNFKQGIGYLYANSAATTIDYLGTLVGTSSTVTKALSYANTNDDQKGFNLMGNPFSCNITGNVTIGGVALTTYYTVEGGSELTAKTLNAENPIKPGQGFMVQATAESQNLVFNPTAKDRNENKGYISIKAGNSKFTDNAFVQIANGNTLRKMTISDNSSIVYVMNGGKDYAAARIDALEGSMPVCFKANKLGSYTITIEAKDIKTDYLHLIDNISHEDIDLLLEPSYTFIASNGDNASRFTLVFRAEGSTVASADIFAYQNGSDIVVNGEGELQVFDVMGRLIATQHINGVETVNVSTTGVYIFKLNEKTQKIVVR